MQQVSYRFVIGTFECLAIWDSTSSLPWNTLFEGVASTDLERMLRKQLFTGGQMTLPSTCLVISTGQHQVLIETGRGTRRTEAHMIPGRLLQTLQQEGISPEEIDTVILSHAHPGHSGGTITASGQAAFPQARYVLWRPEWEFWAAEPDLEARQMQWMVTAALEALRPIQPQLSLIERESEIVPGIRGIAAPGHSAGHMALSICSEGEQLLYLADAVWHPVQLEHPEWVSPFDLRPEQAVASRLRLLDRAVAEQALVHGFHLPFPGLGRVIPQGDAWRWEPL
jgi:glyoxylase-like metal-dependent hydrolase (beta-lactamase superfamily II)